METIEELSDIQTYITSNILNKNTSTVIIGYIEPLPKLPFLMELCDTTWRINNILERWRFNTTAYSYDTGGGYHYGYAKCGIIRSKFGYWVISTQR